MASDPRWFLDKFVVAMASPMLLGDAAGALYKAAFFPYWEEGGGGRGEERVALREIVLPGAVEQLTKVGRMVG